MTISIPPIRDFIQRTIKDFDWGYPTQGHILAAYTDHLLTGRTKSWKSYTRLGIEEFTVKKFQHALLTSEFHLQLLKEQCVGQFGNIDQREVFTLAVDDTSSQRYGQNVFAASIHYDHSQKGYEYGNVLVDYSIKAKSYLDCGYKIYIPKKFLEKDLGHSRDLESKIKLASQIFEDQISDLLALGVSSKQICCTSDSWYGCQQLTDPIRKFGANFIYGIKKSATCILFDKSPRMEDIFKEKDPWKFIRNPKSGKYVYYQAKILNLTTMGKCKVFAIKRGQEKHIRYYATNNLKLTIQTFIKRWKDHWKVEILHDDLKNHLGFGHCYSGREIINCSYWNLCYLLNVLFRYYQLNLKKNDQIFTIFQLWELYCLDHDVSRGKKWFRTEIQIEKAKKRLVAGWC